MMKESGGVEIVKRLSQHENEEVRLLMSKLKEFLKRRWGSGAESKAQNSTK